MKIYLLADESFPYGMAGVNHLICQAKGLISAGENIEIILTHRAVDKKVNDDLPIKGVYKGIKYKYINGKFQYKSRLLRSLYIHFLVPPRTFLWCLKHFDQGDICYQYSTGIELIIAVKIACLMRSAKFVREMVEIPFLDKKLSNRFYRWLELHCLLPYYTGVVCISHGLIDICKKYFDKNSKLFLLPILVEDIKECNYTQSPYNVPYIIHTGSMLEMKDGISYILKGFAKFKEQDTSNCRLIFTGPDADVKNCAYKSMIKELGITDNVDLLGMIQDRKELLRLQHFATMSIVYKVDNLRTKYCFATKIGEILIASVPLITTNATENKYYFRDRINAYLVEPKNIEQLSSTIKHVLIHSEEREKVAQLGRNLALTEFNPEYQGQRLSVFFHSL